MSLSVIKLKSSSRWPLQELMCSLSTQVIIRNLAATIVDTALQRHRQVYPQKLTAMPQKPTLRGSTIPILSIPTAPSVLMVVKP